MTKTLWLMCGAPGSGKSWFAKNILKTDDTWQYISRDEIRFSLIKEGEDYFGKEKQVFKEFCNQIIYACGCDEYHNIIVDATHLNWASRRKLLGAIEVDAYNIKVIPVVVTASLKTILARNQLRNGRERVPEDVIRRMLGRMNDPKNDPYKYTAIMRVTNEQEIKEVLIHD